MLKVLIADDEKKVGLLVKNLIQWEELNLEFMDMVQDGKTAYEVIMEKRPDIVITDIRMPSLSGLEMIEKVTAAGLSVHFIVISGYRYFEYAQTALKFGVKDYLLKPIDEDELNKILKKVCEETEKIRGEQQHVRNLEKNLENSRHILHRELMERAFREQNSYENDISEEEKRSYPGNGIFQAIGIKVDRNISLPRNEEQEKLITDKLAEMLNDILQPQVIDMVVSIKKSMWLLVLLNFQEEKKKSMFHVLNQLFYDMKKYIIGFENYEITMGVGAQTGDFSRINLILEVAAETVRCRIFEGSGICISSCPEGRNRDVKALKIVRNCEEDLKKNIQIFNCNELDRLIRNCFDEADREKVMAFEYYEMGRHLLSEYCGNVTMLFREDMEGILSEWKDSLESCRTISMIKKLVLDSIKAHLTMLEQNKLSLERKPILDTIEYVKNNYEKKILLEDVAEKFGFNPNYFSEMFKKETGKNFSSYLIEVRMEAAKELLRDSSKTIYEIASEVGYKDSKFFSQQFTKTVGIKPTEYRRLYF